jgi:hypothetical protein
VPPCPQNSFRLLPVFAMVPERAGGIAPEPRREVTKFGVTANGPGVGDHRTGANASTPRRRGAPSGVSGARWFHPQGLQLQQRSRAVAQNLGQRIGKSSWLGELENISAGHGGSRLALQIAGNSSLSQAPPEREAFFAR